MYPADAVRDFGLVSAEYDGIGFQAALERDHRVTAVTVWGPDEDEDPDVQVLLDGLDVFRTPADEILAHAARKGWTVNNDDPRAPYIPGVTLAFTRDTSQEVPRTRTACRSTSPPCSWPTRRTGRTDRSAVDGLVTAGGPSGTAAHRPSGGRYQAGRSRQARVREVTTPRPGGHSFVSEDARPTGRAAPHLLLLP
ncbi:hypothetical protein STANM309S_01218 [Streptomyces tanashiensis]